MPREFVDAYSPACPSSTSTRHETEVEGYLERIADLQVLQLHRGVALPEWRVAAARPRRFLAAED